MAETHINAFFAAVDEAEQKVRIAVGEWDTAKARLEVKKKEVGYVEKSNSEESKEKVLPNLDQSDTYKTLKKK